MSTQKSTLVRTLFFVLLGNVLYALAIVVFVLPSGVITGGSTGLALFFSHQFGVPVPLFVSAFNLLMFLFGLLFLGRRFALTTLVSTFAYPFFLGLLQRLVLPRPAADDLLLSILYGGVLMGASLGMVIRAGASTGGTDIPPLILHKKLGIPVALSIYGLDLLILLSQISFTDTKRVLYGILLVLVYTLMIDKVLIVGLSRTQVKIVSASFGQINEAITQRLDRGCTLIASETGYCHEQGFLVLTVVSNRELPRLNQLVLSIDPQAFMIIGRVNEVKGRGFSMKREYRRPE